MLSSNVQMFKCCHTTRRSRRMQSLPHRDVESPKVQIHPEFWVAQGPERRNGMMCGGTNVWGANGRSMHHPTRTEKGTTKRAICLRIAAGGFKADLTGWLCIYKSVASLIPSWHPLTVQALYGSFMHLYHLHDLMTWHLALGEQGVEEPTAMPIDKPGLSSWHQRKDQNIRLHILPGF